MKRILVIDDDSIIRTLLSNLLHKAGYEVVTAVDGNTGLNLAFEVQPDVVITDYQMPGINGLEVLERIREQSRVPVIMLTAKGEDMDKILGLDYGADDYITKPFSYDLLIVKIKGVIRRVYGEYSESTHAEVFEVDGLYMHIHQNVIEYNNRKVELSSKEFLLLYSLLKNVDQIVSREELLEILWNDIDFVDDNTLSVNITRLRKRLEEIGIADAIETKRGQGYRLVNNWGKTLG